MLHGVYGLLALTAVNGGEATCAWRDGDVLEISGGLQTGGLKGRFTRRTERGSGRSLEVEDLGIVITRSGFDGQVAWSQDMSGGIHELTSKFARRLAISMAWLDARQGCAPSTNNRMRWVGSRTINGRRISVWRASPPHGVPFELWYDASSRRLERAFFQMAETRLVRHFSRWRKIEGKRLVAFEQRDEFPEDEDQAVRIVEHARVHRAAGRSDFARPEPPDDATFVGQQSSTNIAFEDDHRTRIYLPVYLNGKGPFLFELDNGGHNILTTQTAAAIGLTASGAFSSTGAGNAVSSSGIGRIARIQIGDAMLRDQPVQIRDFPSTSNDRSPNMPRAGILGLELFERFVVAIDASRKTVTLTKFGSNARPRGLAIPLVFAEDAPLIEGSYNGHKGDFMLDTGNAGPTIIEDFWARPLGLTKALDKGVARGDAKVSTGSVGIGPFDLRGELVSYYGPAERGSEYTRAVAGILGEPLLSRFKATYDYSSATVWLEQLQNIAPLPFDRSGLSLSKADGGQFKVTAVTPNSPAQDAGIRVGDLVSAVGPFAARTLSRADASEIFRSPIGTTILLRGSFGGQEGQKTIVLRQIVRS
jgi:hypothetical protein